MIWELQDCKRRSRHQVGPFLFISRCLTPAFYQISPHSQESPCRCEQGAILDYVLMRQREELQVSV
jgi:hypothetical protein